VGAGREIGFPSNGERIEAYLSTPPQGRGRAVLVVPGGPGLVDPIPDVCDRLAREGFVALAPDLSRREASADPDVAARPMQALDVPRACRDLAGAVEVLLRADAVEGARVGALGFGIGGALALLAASQDPRIGAVVDCYGDDPKVEPALSGLEAPVLGIFAEQDATVPPDAARALEAKLRAAGCRAEITIYPGVGHAFLDEARPGVHDAQTAARAWGEILAFLRRELGAP
jgi:carboxymethylenebutenolidase